MAADQETLPPGTRVAGYEIHRLLGRGGFGAVYEASRPDEGARVALKVLHASMAGHEEVVARFVREAKAVARLKHPNIVGAIEVGDDEGRPYLAMELLVGEALGDLLARETKLPLGRALEVIIPIMAAVRAVHARGIVHRDLKPDNIFLARDAAGVTRPKILDFGFAKMAEPGMQLTGQDTAIGTPNFMSPEQLLSPRGVDPKSDQWALGVLLYFMLTGVKPFAAPTLADTLKNVLRREPTPLAELVPEIPSDFTRALDRALRKQPDERFPSVHDFAEAILPWASSEVSLAFVTDPYLDVEPLPEELSSTPPEMPSRLSRPSRPSTLPSLPPHLAALTRASRPSTLPPRAPARRMEPRPAKVAPPADAMPELVSVVPPPPKRARIIAIAAIVTAAIATLLLKLLAD
ncbi:MAG: serine/threonine-protein kinase [Polyangiales bacterium]